MNVNKLFRRLPIRMKLTIAFALVALLPLTIMGAYGLWMTNASLERNAVAQVRHYVDLVELDVDQLLGQTRLDLDYLEQLDLFPELARRVGEIEEESRSGGLPAQIALFCSSHPVYFQIRFLDPAGSELLRVVDHGNRYADLPARFPDGSGARFYMNAVRQSPDESSISIPVELKHPVLPGRLVPAISIIRRSQDSTGRLQGFWVADLYAERLIEVLRRPAVVPGGELVLCDALGHYLYHPAKKKEWQQLLASRGIDSVSTDFPDEIAEAILSGKEGVITGVGKDIIAHTAVWDDPSSPDRGYVLYYRIPASIAFAPARRFAAAFVLLGIGTLFLVIGAGYLGAGQLTRPLVALSNGARVIASGEFGHRIEVTSNDEIEEVAGDFNRMAEAMADRDQLISDHEAKLAQYAENLEEMVQVRTAELRNSQRLLARSEKMAAVGNLAAGLGHEINNPVGIIMNRIEAILEEIGDSKDNRLQKDLRVLSRHAERISKITENLLRFSRPRELKRTVVDLGSACRSVVGLIGPEFERRGVRLSTRGDARAVSVEGDPDMLEQIVLNLLGNALDASRAGQSVTLDVGQAGGAAVISVRDHGCGIPPEHLDRIFDPFFTTKDVGQGSGLGLTITDQLVRDHGGTIVVNSAVGSGTEFLVKLPPAVEETT